MKSILLVDDEQHTLDSLMHHVAWESLNVRIAGTAGNGKEALEKYRELKPDMIMTDVYMPEMDGIELVQAIRRENPSIPVIILSGYGEFENARRAMKWGVNHFLLKPAGVPEIEAVIRELIQELDVSEQKQRLEEQYKREIDRMIPFMREKLLHEMLTSRYQPGNIPAERLQYLNMPNPEEVLAVSLQIHRPAFLAKLSERDWQLLKFGADNIVRELAEEEFRGNPSLNWYILEYTDGLLVIVLFHRIREEETLYSAAERLSEKATEKIRTYLKIDAFAGIGTVRSSLAGLLDSFLESREVLETAEFQGAGQVYPFREWGRLRSGVDQYGPLLKCWNESLNLRDMEKARRSWERIREHLLRESPPSLSETQTICVGIMSSLMYFWNEQFPLIPPPHTMSRFLEEIQKYYTLADLVGWLDSWVGEWLRAGSQELFGKKGNRLVESVKQYVEEHYREDISFSAIARELFVHPKYLSQLFKRVTGENFVNYLNKFRIQKAIDYLQTGEHMVYEVSEMVGYKNPTYFSQVFKMITGKSPSEFIKP